MGSSYVGKQHPPSVEDYQLLIKGCLHCVNQCEELVASLSAEDYGCSHGGSSSIGGHIRHILDRYQSLFLGLPGLTVDYDARKRDKSIETSIDSARFAIASVFRRIQELDIATIAGQSITVRETVYQYGSSIEIASTVERELMGLITHSIHHLAIIRLLAKQIGYELDQSFGKAPSTIVYEQS